MMKLSCFSLILIALLTATFLSACKKDLTSETDITKSEWRVEFIKQGIKKTKTPKKDYHGNSISKSKYILSFTTDSTCMMSYGINQGFGNYEIENIGEIDIEIGGMTEICCDSEFDEELSKLFPKMETYKVMNKKLILEGDNCSIQLEK